MNVANPFGGGPLDPTIAQVLLQIAAPATQGILFPRTTGGQVGRAVVQGLGGLGPILAQNLQKQQIQQAISKVQAQARQGPQGQVPALPPGGILPAGGIQTETLTGSAPSLFRDPSLAGLSEEFISGRQPPSLAPVPGVSPANAPRFADFTQFSQGQPEEIQKLIAALRLRDVPEELLFTKPQTLTPAQRQQQNAIRAVRENRTLAGLTPQQTLDASLGRGRPPVPQQIPSVGQDLERLSQRQFGIRYQDTSLPQRLELSKLRQAEIETKETRSEEARLRISRAQGRAAAEVTAKAAGGEPFKPKGILLDPKTLESVTVSKANALEKLQSGEVFEVTTDQLKQIGFAKRARVATDRLEKLVNIAIEAETPFETLGQATRLGIQGFFPGTLAITIKQLRLGQAGLFARFISTEVGRLTDPDIKRALGFIPGISDSKQTAQFKFNMMRRFIDTAVDSVRRGTSFSASIRDQLDEGEARLQELGGTLSLVSQTEVDKIIKDADKFGSQQLPRLPANPQFRVQ